jgi:dTDP-4-amino-4,6-dideoxygalactose transaminase
LSDWAQENGVRLPIIPVYTEQAYHMFYMLLPNLDLRQKLIQYLRELGIQSVFHYLPLHLSDMGQGFGGKVGDCPVTEDVSDRLVRLPFHNGLSNSEQELAIEAILGFAF